MLKNDLFDLYVINYRYQDLYFDKDCFLWSSRKFAQPRRLSSQDCMPKGYFPHTLTQLRRLVKSRPDFIKYKEKAEEKTVWDNEGTPNFAPSTTPTPSEKYIIVILDKTAPVARTISGNAAMTLYDSSDEAVKIVKEILSDNPAVKIGLFKCKGIAKVVDIQWES